MACHRALHEWGKATVVEVENNAQSTTCVLWLQSATASGHPLQWARA